MDSLSILADSTRGPSFSLAPNGVTEVTDLKDSQATRRIAEVTDQVTHRVTDVGVSPIAAPWSGEQLWMR